MIVQDLHGVKPLGVQNAHGTKSADFALIRGMDSAWFRQRMADLSLDQDDIGNALGLDRSVISRIINGRQPVRVDQLDPLARILQVSFMEMLRRVGALNGGSHGDWLPIWNIWNQIPTDQRDRARKILETLIGSGD